MVKFVVGVACNCRHCIMYYLTLYPSLHLGTRLTYYVSFRCEIFGGRGYD